MILKRAPSWPKAGQSLPPDGLGGLPPEVVASPARVSVVGLPRPVKGSLRRALPALDRTRQPERRESDGPIPFLAAAEHSEVRQEPIPQRL